MKTAVIVAGVIREFNNASSSWKINGDYYLFADEYVREAQSQVIKRKVDIFDINQQSNIRFKDIIIMNTEYNPDWAGFVPIVNLYKKLLFAYEHIKTMDYSKIIVIRPDLFIAEDSNTIINDIVIDPLSLSIQGVINQGDERTRFRPSIDKDTLMCMDLSTFKIIADFYYYIVDNIHYILANNFDIHTLLGKYVIEKKLNVKDLGVDTVVLRSNTDYLFKSGNATMENLKKEASNWWKDIVPQINPTNINGGILKLRNK